MAHAAPQLTLEVQAKQRTATATLQNVLDELDRDIVITNVPESASPGSLKTKDVDTDTDTLPSIPDTAFDATELFDAAGVKNTDISFQWKGSPDYGGVWEGLGWSFTYSPYNSEEMDVVDENKAVLDALANAADDAGIHYKYYMNVRTV